MKTVKIQRSLNAERTKNTASVLLHVICMLAITAFAVFLRTAPLSMTGETEETKAVYTDEEGTPYLTDLDSYYHVRLVNNFLKNRMLGDSYTKDGTPRDTLSYYPEGRSAAYQPGIVYLTVLFYRLFGGSLNALEYRIGAFVAALAAIAAYLIGLRISGRAGAIASGLLVSCAPIYVLRTCYGRFDTDMFVVLIELFLIFFITEILRADSRKNRILSALGFALTAIIFSLCWTPTYGMLFVGLTLFGGLLFLIVSPFLTEGHGSCAAKFIRQPAIPALAASVAVIAVGLVITTGPKVFSNIIRGLFFSTASETGQGSLPNLLASIAELATANLFPENLSLSFYGYIPNEAISGVNGIGGAMVLIFAFAGFMWLFISGIPRFRNEEETLSAKDSLIYVCVLVPWFAACLYLTHSGSRFIEHLSIPAGLLAGGMIGRLFMGITLKKRPVRFVISALVTAAVLIPALIGSYQASADSRPTVTDSSMEAMRFIKENAEDPSAVISSWWDMGYYYESESGHPCMWDGGTQNGVRAILISKALTTDDPILAGRILLMLSHCGNSAVNLLMQHCDTAAAFDILWEVLVTDKENALSLLESKGNLSAEDAENAWSLMRPDKPKETYLLLTYMMTGQIGWYEYYANWDFTGTQEIPESTYYAYAPDGTPLSQTEEGKDYMESTRKNELLWRLFFDAKKTPSFEPVFEWHDGLEHVRIWKVRNIE